MTFLPSDNLRPSAADINDLPWAGTVTLWPTHADRERYLKYRRQGHSRGEALRRMGMAIVSDDEPAGAA